MRLGWRDGVRGEEKKKGGGREWKEGRPAKNKNCKFFLGGGGGGGGGGGRKGRRGGGVLAAGGINAALGTRDPEDSWQQHFADTLREGYYLSDPRVVELMARERRRPLRSLPLGAATSPARRRASSISAFRAHKYRRTCYAGDYTGRAIIQALAGKIDELHIPVLENQYVSRLLVRDGVCFGRVGLRPRFLGSERPNWQTPSSCVPAAIPVLSAGVLRAAMRTMATACTWPCKPAAGSPTWRWSSSTPREWSGPRRCLARW